MKTIKFLSAIALTLAMTACDDFDLPNPPYQTNVDEAAFANTDLKLVQASEALNLKDANENDTPAVLANITELSNFPATYDLSFTAEVGSNENFDKIAEVPVEIQGEQLIVNPDLFNGAIQQVITKAPGTLKVPVRIAAYATRGNTKVRLGGPDANYGQFVYDVTTLDPAKVIEEAYYLVGSFCNWDVKKAIRLEHTVAGANQYDNPEFAVKIDVTAEQAATGYEWKIIPASSYQAGTMDAALGCRPADETALTGKLVETEGNTEAGVIKLTGPVLITANIEVGSYQVSYALDCLYILSGTSVMNPAQAMRLFTENFITYSGAATISGTWYCAGEPSTTGLLFKQDTEKGFEDFTEKGVVRTGYLLSGDKGTQNLSSPLKGNNLFWVEVNLVQLTYRIAAIEKMSVIGSGNGWDLATASELTPSKDRKVWTGKNIHVGDQFKINCNGAWEIDFGGPADPSVTGGHQYILQYKGANMEISEGDYDVEVNFGVYPYTVTLK